MIDPARLRTSALTLERLLSAYVDEDPQVRLLADSLASLIEQAKQGQVRAAVAHESIPGSYWFTEGHLGRFDDLESAYADFKLEVSGLASDPEVQRALEMIEAMQRAASKGGSSEG